MVVTPRYLSKTFVVIYWIALPVLGLGTVGGVLFAISAEPASLSAWNAPVASAAITGLIAWRLFKYQRALAATRPLSKSELELFSDAPESEKTE